MKTIGALLVTVLLATAALAEYREIPMTNGATVSGAVHVLGPVTALPPQPVFKQQETCGTSMPDERLLVGGKGELANAIVYLSDIKAGKAAQLGQAVRLDNRKCSFAPHVLTATLGQTLEIHNEDPFLHDAHAWLGPRTLFNVAILKGKTVQQPLLDAGLIHINCNIRHTWMHAYILVSEHPYHTVTGADGRFRIDNVPPGVWTLRVWHELLGSTDQQVRMQSGESREITVNLQGTTDGTAPE